MINVRLLIGILTLLGLASCPCLHAIQEAQYQYSDRMVLEDFFHELLRDTTVGYVLFGRKPLAVETFSKPENTTPGTSGHFTAVQATLSAYLLGEVNDVMIHHGQDEIEIAFVNKKQFFKILKDHILLFQHKFGIHFTPEILLQIMREQSFRSLFATNIALQGVILGYGVENAISYERGTKLKQSFLPVHPQPPYSLTKEPGNEAEMLDEMQAQAGWDAIQEDLEDFTYDQRKHFTDLVKIPFTYHRNSHATQQLIRMYQKDQTKVNAILNSKSCFAAVMRRLGGTLQCAQVTAPKLEPFFSEEELQRLPSLIAQSVVDGCFEEISPAFFEGIGAAKESVEPTASQDLDFFKILKNRDLVLRAEIHRYFDRIRLIPDIECCIPKKLYFQTVHQTLSDQQLNGQCSLIQARYCMKDMQGNPIHGTFHFCDPVELRVDKLIPGLAHGIQGMREGEIREVYIHPDLMYGTASQFAKGRAAQVVIELIKIISIDAGWTLPSLTPVEVQHHAGRIASCQEFIHLQDRYAYECGFRVGAYYKPFLPPDQLICGIQKAALHAQHVHDSSLLKLQWLLHQKLRSCDAEK